jgi:hypothetical protein
MHLGIIVIFIFTVIDYIKTFPSIYNMLKSQLRISSTHTHIVIVVAYVL